MSTVFNLPPERLLTFLFATANLILWFFVMVRFGVLHYRAYQNSVNGYGFLLVAGMALLEFTSHALEMVALGLVDGAPFSAAFNIRNQIAIVESVMHLAFGVVILRWELWMDENLFIKLDRLTSKISRLWNDWKRPDPPE